MKSSRRNRVRRCSIHRQKRKQEIENTIKDLTAREKEKQRKARVTRLVQIGAIATQYLQCPDITPTDFEKLIKKVVEALRQIEATKTE